MKKIGIPGWVMENSFGVGFNYLEFIERFGKPVIITPIDSEDLPEIDMLLCPGGADILPTSYGQRPNFRTSKSNIFLEHFDAEILPKYIENGVPVFAICRGMQRLWTMYGGQLQQHNNWHEQSIKSPQDQCHELTFVDAYKDYGKLIKKVTSRHHQCADASKFVPEDLEVIAYAKASPTTYFDDVVEIFKHKTLQITGVQFHPEDHDYTDELSSLIIRGYLGI